jgi:hypothetical protein
MQEHIYYEFKMKFPAELAQMLENLGNNVETSGEMLAKLHALSPNAIGMWVYKPECEESGAGGELVTEA